ncbi:helix-turn-helix domain-containing protein [Kitasatospora cystarginea]|uniref:Helix-turn-helix domain-containing protein n=1 Tax=Kitasatospora cystarginea TaxID=58350 RepID=A0ABP5QHK9_9ACTN
MLRNVIAPSRDFTQVANTLVWDDDLSDTAFRLLVRALALPPSRARGTTVTELAAGLPCGRITADRARRQLSGAGLLHCARWRSATGQVRTESLISSVPLDEAEVERLFAEHFANGRPGAGRRAPGGPAARESGTALPAGERLEGETSPLPVPAQPEPEPGPELGQADPAVLAEAEQVLLSLRRTDPRLVLGAAEVGRLLPLAAEWLARGVSSAAMRHALTAGLPAQLKCPSALLRCRLRDKMPAPVRIASLTSCEGCDRAFRPLNGELRCGSCRQESAAAAAAPARADGGGLRIGWRDRVALAVQA